MVFGLLSCHNEVRKWCKKNFHVFEKLLTLLRPDFDQLTNEYAAMWVRNMSEDYAIKATLVENQEAVTNLITIVGFTDPDSVYNALGALNNICADFEARNLVCELKGIEPILNLMKSEFPQIQELVFGTLIKLTHSRIYFKLLITFLMDIIFY